MTYQFSLRFNRGTLYRYHFDQAETGTHALMIKVLFSMKNRCPCMSEMNPSMDHPFRIT